MIRRSRRVVLGIATLAIAGVQVTTSLGLCLVPGPEQDACTSYTINCTTPGGTHYPCWQVSSNSGCSVTTVVDAAIGYPGRDAMTSSITCYCTYAPTTCHPVKQQCVSGETTPINNAISTAVAGAPCTGVPNNP